MTRRILFTIVALASLALAANSANAQTYRMRTVVQRCDAFGCRIVARGAHSSVCVGRLDNGRLAFLSAGHAFLQVAGEKFQHVEIEVDGKWLQARYRRAEYQENRETDLAAIELQHNEVLKAYPVSADTPDGQFSATVLGFLGGDKSVSQRVVTATSNGSELFFNHGEHLGGYSGGPIVTDAGVVGILSRHSGERYRNSGVVTIQEFCRKVWGAIPKVRESLEPVPDPLPDIPPEESIPPLGVPVSRITGEDWERIKRERQQAIDAAFNKARSEFDTEFKAASQRTVRESTKAASASAAKAFQEKEGGIVSRAVDAAKPAALAVAKDAVAGHLGIAWPSWFAPVAALGGPVGWVAAGLGVAGMFLARKRRIKRLAGDHSMTTLPKGWDIEQQPTTVVQMESKPPQSQQSAAVEHHYYPTDEGLSRMRTAHKMVARNHPQHAWVFNMAESTYKLLQSGEGQTNANSR